MYPIVLSKHAAPLQFEDRRAMVVWLFDHLDTTVYLVVAPVYWLKARIVGGVVYSLLDDEESVNCWAMTDAGYHKIEFRDADGFMVARVSQPRADYYPGGKEGEGPKDKKRKRAGAKRSRKGSVQEPSGSAGADPRPGQPVGEALASPKYYEHYPSWRDRSPVRAKTPGAR